MTDRLRASAVTATQIDAFMAFITYVSVTVLPRYTRPLCLQRPERFIMAGHRAAITPCDRFWALAGVTLTALERSVGDRAGADPSRRGADLKRTHIRVPSSVVGQFERSL